MHVDVHLNASAFLSKASEFLLADEAGHNLLLEATANLVQEPKAKTWFATAVDNPGGQESGAVIAAGIWIPRHPLLLGAQSDEAAWHLARSAWSRRPANEANLSSLLSPASAAKAFCEAWRELGGAPGRLGREIKILKLDLTQGAPPPPAPGRLRRAWLEDLSQLEKWAVAFAKESKFDEAIDDTRKLLRRAIEARRLFVWDQNGPVAMAGCAGNTPNGVRINNVFTPHEYRRKGFARAIVWGLGQWLRQIDKRFSCLFVDRRNAIAETLYLQLGYRESGTCVQMLFDRI